MPAELVSLLPFFSRIISFGMEALLQHDAQWKPEDLKLLSQGRRRCGRAWTCAEKQSEIPSSWSDSMFVSPSLRPSGSCWGQTAIW